MRRNATSLKILEYLLAGSALTFVRTKSGRRQIYEHTDVIWQSIDRKCLYQALDRLHLQGAIKIIREGNKRERIAITNKARAATLSAHFERLAIEQPKRWDRVWRAVVYDIPEEKRAARDALRRKLRDLGFLEFQKSVFIYPYECRDEINFVINYFDIEDHVYYLESYIQPDTVLRRHFKL